MARDLKINKLSVSTSRKVSKNYNTVSLSYGMEIDVSELELSMKKAKEMQSKMGKIVFDTVLSDMKYLEQNM